MIQCRACLRYKSVSINLVDVKALDVFTYCTSLKIDLNDTLPKTVCKLCYDLLNKLYDFKKQCVQSDEILRQDEKLLKPIKTENESSPKDKIKVEQHDKKWKRKKLLEGNEIKMKRITRSKKQNLELSNMDDIIKKEKVSETTKKYEESLLPKQEIEVEWCTRSKKKKLELMNDVIKSEKPNVVSKQDEELIFHKDKINIENNNYDDADVLSDGKYDDASDASLFEEMEVKLEFTSDSESFEPSKAKKKKTKVLKKQKTPEQTKTRVVVQVDNEYLCPYCGEKCQDLEKFFYHKDLHKKEKEKKCFKCEKFYSHWCKLVRHYNRTHITSLRCSICLQSFITRSAMLVHKKIHNEKKDKKEISFFCHVCAKSFGSMYSLKSHIKTHQENREKTCVCKICDKKFFNQSSVNLHMLKHKERRFTCDLCQFRLYTKAALRKHLYIHDEIKRFPCKICNKRLSTRSSQILHMRIHSGDRPHSCDICDMKCISKQRLREHLRIHTGEKPFKCNTCGHAFSQQGTFTRHVKTVHNKQQTSNTTAYSILH